MTIIDSKLYNQTLEIVKSFVSFLENQQNLKLETKASTFYKPTHETVTKNTYASLTITEEKEISNDYSKLVIKYKDQIDSSLTDKFENIMNIVYKGKCRPNIWLNFITNYLELVDDMVFNQAQFDLLYTDFQNFLSREPIHFRTLTVIPNLAINSEEIVIGKNEKLIQMNETDFNFIFNNTFGKNYLHKLLLPGYGTIFEQEFTEPLNHDQNPLNNVSRDLLLTSLKLFSAGDISIYNSIAQISNPFYSSYSLGVEDRIPLENLQKSFILPKNKEKNFVDFYQLVKKKRPSFSFFINLSLKRFEDSYLRKSDDDKLVDVIIALEGLYLQQGSNDPHSLALCLAWFIGTDFKDRKKIYKSFSDAYNYRNVIVHGSNTKQYDKFRKDLRKSLEILHEYYRKSLTMFVNEKLHTLTKEKLTKKIADKVLGS